MYASPHLFSAYMWFCFVGGFVGPGVWITDRFVDLPAWGSMLLRAFFWVAMAVVLFKVWWAVRRGTVATDQPIFDPPTMPCAWCAFPVAPNQPCPECGNTMNEKYQKEQLRWVQFCRTSRRWRRFVLVEPFSRSSDGPPPGPDRGHSA